MDVLFARFVHFVMCSIEMAYGRGICAFCAIPSGLNRDFLWTCYLRELCNLCCVKLRCLVEVLFARFVRFVMSRYDIWTCYLLDLCDL